MNQEEAVDAVQTELDKLIDETEDELGRPLDDDEYDSLVDEFLDDLDDDS